MIPVGWLFTLNHVVPGALLLLGISWFLAMVLTRRFAKRAAHRLADQHQLTGEDRDNFLAWSIKQKSIAATAHVFPTAVVTWCVLMALCVIGGVISVTTGGLQPPAAPQAGQAFEDLHRAANAGDAESQFKIGSAYEGGIGVAHDDREALRWFLMAARQGHMEAQFYVGQAYHQGFGTKQDLNEGIRWFEKAARQGDVMAQFNLGATYEFEPPPLRNLKKARYWYVMAADQDYGYAKEALARLDGTSPTAK